MTDHPTKPTDPCWGALDNAQQGSEPVITGFTADEIDEMECSVKSDAFAAKIRAAANRAGAQQVSACCVAAGKTFAHHQLSGLVMGCVAHSLSPEPPRCQHEYLDGSGRHLATCNRPLPCDWLGHKPDAVPAPLPAGAAGEDSSKWHPPAAPAARPAEEPNTCECGKPLATYMYQDDNGCDDSGCVHSDADAPPAVADDPAAMRAAKRIEPWCDAEIDEVTLTRVIAEEIAPLIEEVERLKNDLADCANSTRPTPTCPNPKRTATARKPTESSPFSAGR